MKAPFCEMTFSPHTRKTMNVYECDADECMKANAVNIIMIGLFIDDGFQKLIW